MTARHNGIKVMANLTGLSEATVTGIAQQVKENIDRLHACASHAFEPIPPTAPIRQRYRCAHCAGEVDSGAYRWYMQGRAHEAARNAADPAGRA
jgi:hypothetical protein